MKLLKQITILLFVLLQTAVFSQKSDLESITTKLDSLLKEQNEGVAILVKKDNKIQTTSLGTFQLTEKSVFNIGSATKTFTAILILQEQEKGNLKLTDSIGSYLTSIKNVPSSLTIEELLTHQSGLDEVIGSNIQDIFYAKNDSIYASQLLQQVETYNTALYGKFDYCNTNYFLLGKILENITDESYFDLLKNRIINPLQLKNTYPYLHKNLPNLAVPYHENKDVSTYLDYRFFANIAYAAGSIASTLSDMEKFYTALFNSEILLKKETVKMMLQEGNETYGYGLFKTSYDGQKYYEHGGNNIGYAFRNGYNPETNNMYLMFTNSMRIPSKKLFEDSLLAYLHDKKIEDFTDVDLSFFEKYTGTYLLKEAGLELEILKEANKLYLVVDAQRVKSELIQKDGITLYDTQVGVTLSVIVDKVNCLTFNQNGFETTITKVTKVN